MRKSNVYIIHSPCCLIDQMIYPKCKKGLHHNILLSLAREIFIINTKEKEEEEEKKSKQKGRIYIYKEREGVYRQGPPS